VLIVFGAKTRKEGKKGKNRRRSPHNLAGGGHRRCRSRNRVANRGEKKKVAAKEAREKAAVRLVPRVQGKVLVHEESRKKSRREGKGGWENFVVEDETVSDRIVLHVWAPDARQG